MTDVRQALVDAVARGTSAAITFDDILAAGQVDATSPSMRSVAVDLTGVSGWTPGNALAALGASADAVLGNLPDAVRGYLPAVGDAITPQRIVFRVLPAARALAQVSLVAGIKGGTIPVGGIQLTLSQLEIVVAQPLDPDRRVRIMLYGDVSQGGATVDNLAFTLSLPDAQLDLRRARSGDGVSIAAILAAVGIPAGELDALDFVELDLHWDLRSMAAALELVIESTGAGTAAATPAAGLSLQSLTINANTSGGATQASFSGDVTYTVPGQATLGFDCDARYLGGQWQLDARCFADDDGTLPLTTLLGALGIPAGPLPTWLNDVGVESIALAATVGKGDASVSFSTDVQVTPTLPDGATASVDAAISIDRAGASGASTGQIDLTLDIDGFPIKGTYTFGSDPGTLTIEATIGGETVTGTWSGGAITLTFTGRTLSIGGVLAEVIGAVTGNAQYRLASPFDLLNDVVVRGATLTITPKSKAFGVTLALDPVDILGVVTVTGVTLSYASGSTTDSGFGVTIDYTAFGAPQSVTHDPTAGSPPPVKGTSWPLLSLNGLVAGQNATLVGPADADVASALATALAAIRPIQPDGGPVILPPLAPGGWVLGADLLIRRQIRFRFLFADPQFYGAALDVIQSRSGGGSAYLAALVGLSAEISYHKVDDTLGVYAASLTLPSSTRDPSATGALSLPLCSVQLPSLSARIYTDGDFYVDIGFPTNLDFSKSLTVRVEEYIGSGGVYFGRLSGADAPPLQIPADVSVGTVTELGVGMRLGIYYAESFGPLSGSLSITAQGLFEGTFAELTHAGGSTDEYYDILAALSVSGILKGTLNFYIISASLYVDIEVHAAVRAVYGQPVNVQVGASVDVTLEASINLGLFSISKSFSFSATVSESFQIAGGALVTGARRLSAGAPTSLAGHFIGNPVKWAVETWVTPILTRNRDRWSYVLDFSVKTDPDVTYSQFSLLVTNVLQWFVYAYLDAAGQLPQPVDEGSLWIDPGGLHDLDALIAGLASDPSQGFTLDDARWLCRNSLWVNFAEMPATAQGRTVNVAGMPWIPGVTWSFSGQAIEPSDVADSYARDYFVMLAHATVRYAIDYVAESKATGPIAITLLVQALAEGSPSRLQQIAGLATRFTMHGHRVPVDGTPMAIVEAAGLQHDVDPASIGAVSFTLTGPGQSVPFTLTTAGAAPSPTLFSPTQIAQFATTPAIDALWWTVLSPTVEAPRAFMCTGTTPLRDASGASIGTLWRLPRNLERCLIERGQPAMFDVGVPAPDGSADPEDATPLAGRFAFATVIDLVLERDPGEPDAWWYAIHSIRGRSRARLSDLLETMTTPSPVVSSIELAYRSAAGAAGGPAEMTAVMIGDGTYVYVTNFSAQDGPSSPPGQFPPQAQGPGAPLLLALQACAMANRGGFYFVAGDVKGGLPDAAFDERGLATVSLIVNTIVSSSNQVGPYHSAIRVQDALPPDVERLIVSSDSITSTRRRYMPGVLGVEATLTMADTADDAAYQRSLGSLFHLLGFAPVVDGDNVHIDLTDAPAVTSPSNAGNPRVYRRMFDVFEYTKKQPTPYVRFATAETLLPGDPEDAQDPYALVGAFVNIAASVLVDPFGNTMPLSAVAPPIETIRIPWTDDLLPINQWPGMSARYAVVGGDTGPVLRLSLDWTPPTVMTEAVRTRLLQQYTAVYYQLGYADATIDTSLLVSGTWPVDSAAPLAARLRQVVRDVLASIVAGAPHVAAIDLPAPDWGTFNRQLFYVLRVQLRLALRPGIYVGGGDAGAFTVGTSLFPDQWDPDGPSAGAAGGSTSSVPAFGRAFERAFAVGDFASLQFKLMTAEVDDAGDPQLWVLRYGPLALNFSFDAASPASCVLPVPLARQLVDRPGPGGPMDLDASMARFLDALDTFLAPGVAVPAAGSSPGAAAQVARVQASKVLLADVLCELVTDSMDGMPATNEGCNVFRQALLKSAKSFYAIAGAVEYGIIARLYTELSVMPMAVYGTLVHGAARGAAFSSAATLLEYSASGRGHVASGFTVHDLDETRSIEAPAAFDVKGIRVAIGAAYAPPATLPNVQFPPRLTGAWLRFVVPPEPVPLPPRSIPVPMRAIPAAPAIVDQSFGVEPVTAPPSVADLKRWTLSGSYRRRPAVQDVLTVSIQTNVPPDTPRVAAAPVHPLVQAIADFETFWAANGQYLGPQLAQNPADPRVVAAIGGFAAACSAITTAAQQAPVTLPTPAVPGASLLAYDVTEGPVNGDLGQPWQIVATRVPSMSAIPEPGTLGIAIADWTSSATRQGDTAAFIYGRAGAPILAPQALGLTERTLTLPRVLDIVGAQSAQLYYTVTRNRGFAEAFVYMTPATSAARAIFPHVEITDPFDIGVGRAATLAEQISLYLTSLLATPLPARQSPVRLQIALESAFDATGASSGAIPMVRRPIAFLPGVELAPNPSVVDLAEIVASLVTAFVRWTPPGSGPLGPTEPWVNLRLGLRTALYAQWDTGMVVPLVSLPNAYVSLANTLGEAR